MEDLKPCPFCGSDAIMNYKNLIHCIETVKCGAQVESGDHGDLTVELTVKSWNTRVTEVKQ